MVCVTKAGTKTFYVRWADERTGERHKLPLPHGRWPAMKVTEARKAAQKAIGQVRSGRDLKAVRKASRARANAAEQVLTLAGLIEAWDDLHLSTRRPSYRREAVRALRHGLADHLTKAAADLSRAALVAVSEKLQRAGKRSAARHLLTYGSALYGWAVSTGRVSANPFAGIPLPQSGERDRVLTDAELGAIYAAAEHRPYPSGPSLRLLILTGLRRDEVAGMQWSELARDLSIWSIPASRMKSKKAHTVHLSPPARAILQGLRDGQRLYPESDLVFTTTGATP